MKKALFSVIVLVATFVTIMLVGAKSNNVVVNLDSGDGIQYMLYAVLSVGCALCASAYFKTNRKKCAILALLAALIPAFAGVTTFIVAGVFSAIIIVTTDVSVVEWFKNMTAPETEE